MPGSWFDFTSCYCSCIIRLGKPVVTFKLAPIKRMTGCMSCVRKTPLSRGKKLSSSVGVLCRHFLIVLCLSMSSLILLCCYAWCAELAISIFKDEWGEPKSTCEIGPSGLGTYFAAFCLHGILLVTVWTAPRKTGILIQRQLWNFFWNGFLWTVYK